MITRRVKSILISSLLFYSFTSYAGLSDIVRENETNILNAIDDICSDTWCEGAEFSFKSFKCNDIGDCSLDFESYEYIKYETTVGSVEPGSGEVFGNNSSPIDFEISRFIYQYNGKCSIHGVKSLEDLIEGSSNLNRNFFSIQDSLYDQLTDCISAIESKVRSEMVK